MIETLDKLVEYLSLRSDKKALARITWQQQPVLSALLALASTMGDDFLREFVENYVVLSVSIGGQGRRELVTAFRQAVIKSPVSLIQSKITRRQVED